MSWHLYGPLALTLNYNGASVLPRPYACDLAARDTSKFMGFDKKKKLGCSFVFRRTQHKVLIFRLMNGDTMMQHVLLSAYYVK